MHEGQRLHSTIRNQVVARPHRTQRLGAHRHEHADSGAKRPISRLVICKAGEIPREQERRDDPRHRSEYAADSHPLPTRRAAIRAAPVKDGETDQQDDKQHWPAGDPGERLG